MSKEILSDVTEATSLLETYNLVCLVWRFNECPLNEVRHYIPRGKEELVVLCHKDDSFAPYRLVNDGGQWDAYDIEHYLIELAFHKDYHLFIVLNPNL